MDLKTTMVHKSFIKYSFYLKQKIYNMGNEWKQVGINAMITIKNSCQDRSSKKYYKLSIVVFKLTYLWLNELNQFLKPGSLLAMNTSRNIITRW